MFIFTAYNEEKVMVILSNSEKYFEPSFEHRKQTTTAWKVIPQSIA